MQISWVYVVVLCLGLASCGGERNDAKSGDVKVAGHDRPRGEERKKSSGPKELELTEEEMRAEGVKLQTVTLSQEARTIEASASIIANADRLVRVMPRAPGRIMKAAVGAGSVVVSGQELAVIESAEVGEAISAFQQARSEDEVAHAALRRATTLYHEQVIPEKDLLKAQSDAKRAAAARQAAASKLSLLGAEARDQPITRASATYTLTTPIAGTVIEKRAIVGEHTAQDQALYTVADLSTVWVEIDLQERDLAAVRARARVTATVPAWPEQRFIGEVGYISDTVDRATHTLKIRVVLKNEDRRLKPGMFATVRIATPTADSVLVIPAAAVVLLQGQSTVFVREGGHFDPKAVETRPLGDGRVAVDRGLEPGREVVTAGAFALKARLLKSQITED